MFTLLRFSVCIIVQVVGAGVGSDDVMRACVGVLAWLVVLAGCVYTIRVAQNTTHKRLIKRYPILHLRSRKHAALKWLLNIVLEH